MLAGGGLGCWEGERTRDAVGGRYVPHSSITSVGAGGQWRLNVHNNQQGVTTEWGGVKIATMSGGCKRGDRSPRGWIIGFNGKEKGKTGLRAYKRRWGNSKRRGGSTVRWERRGDGERERVPRTARGESMLSSKVPFKRSKKGWEVGRT